jgi:Bifunctional DNA primase/polymerase, N-terminal
VRQVFLEGRPLHIFPCGWNKRPCCPNGFKDAVADAASIEKLWARYPGPLIGVATGVINCVDVIDIDPRNGGHKWLAANPVPVTRTHRTPGGGCHLIYKHRPGLRNVDIAPGVQIKTTGGYVVWWPASPHKWPVLVSGPVAEFPASLIDSVNGGAIEGEVHPLIPQPGSNHPQATINVTLRSKTLIHNLTRCPVGNRHKLLYWTACRFGNMIGEKRMTTKVAEHLLIGAAKINGLWKDDPENCLVTVRDGLRDGTVQVLDRRVDFPLSKEFDLTTTEKLKVVT